MSCSSCKTSTQLVKGCRNNGGCSTGGCNKMNTFDWLSDMSALPNSSFNIVEIRFKAGRKEFYRNVNNLKLSTGDAVIVNVPSGHHIGYVALQGELVRLQMKKKNINDNEEIKEVYRLASNKDLEKYHKLKDKEDKILLRTRTIILDLKLEMKLTDVECQADGTKATFYYSAEDRVDFRELIKILAGEFKTRVEMRQINLRQEAGRIGGIGSCGRELCCSTWLSDFKTVSTSAARYQNLSLSPTKLSGQCGRLKCCLNYELETYVEALKNIPEVKAPLKTKKGEAKLQKTDIFRKILWFGFENETQWYAIDATRVIEIIALNNKGVVPESLTENEIDHKSKNNSVNSDLDYLDKKLSQKSKISGKRKKRRNKKNVTSKK